MKNNERTTKVVPNKRAGLQSREYREWRRLYVLNGE